MVYFKVDNDNIWALYDEDDNSILYIFKSREDAIVKMSDYSDVKSLQLTNVSRSEEGWVIKGISWKELVFDLVKKATASQTENVELSVEPPVL